MNKILKKTLIITGVALSVVVLFAGGYVGYVYFSYSRIGDKKLDIDSKVTKTSLSTSEEYKALSYNIGFGAYSQDFTFFMDEGYDENGEKTCGHYGKAKSKEEVEFNINGAIKAVKDENPDFICLQEVDTNSDRSHHINQDELFTKNFEEYDHTHCVNFNSAFFPVPLYDMHGASKSGMTTYSKVKINQANRVEYTISDSFSKFFDLDRCFSYHVMDVENGKKFYLVNSHMSAYDEGGVIRAKQLKQLNDFLESVKGEYVVICGDYNHDLLTFNPDYSYNKENRPYNATLRNPDWLNDFFNDKGESPLIDGYKVVCSDNSPSCRNNDIEWIQDKTFVCTVDGFIISENIEVVEHHTILTKDGNKHLDGFAYSDHEPTEMTFRLK